MSRKYDQTTMTERTTRCEFGGLNLKEILNLASSLLLPLMLGIFTVVITFQQQKVAQQQRFEDRLSAQEQREQDLRNWAIQREQDLNSSKQQRELERLLADEKRQQDYELANATRMMAKEQRNHELDIEIERHRDSLFVAYMNELGSLLDKNNGTVTSNAVTAALVRAKTLTLARQLDPIRNSHLIRFLYEVGQLTNGKQPLDLSNAELNEIDLSTKTRHAQMRRLYLAGAYLNNASFAYQDLKGSNFNGAQLRGAIFRDVILDEADLSSCQLDNADFSKAQMSRSLLIGSNLVQAHFTSANIAASNLSLSIMIQVDGSHLNAESAQFIHTDLRSSTLSSSNFVEANFLRATMDYCDLAHANLTGAKLDQTTLTYSNFANAILTRSQLYMANISHMNMQNATVTSDQLDMTVSLDQAISSNGELMKDIPLIRNGHVDCLRNSTSHGWHNENNAEILIYAFDGNPKNCYFAPRPNLTSAARIYQSLDVNAKYGDLIREGRAITLTSARFGKATMVDLNYISYYQRQIVSESVLLLSEVERIFRIPTIATNINVIIEFDSTSNPTEKWCDYVDLVIQVDRSLF